MLAACAFYERCGYIRKETSIWEPGKVKFGIDVYVQPFVKELK